MKYSEEVLNRAKIVIEIGNAILEGKEIEYKDLYSQWWDLSDQHSFNFYKYDYRVKPTPEFIPFDFSDAEFLIDKVIKYKDGTQIQKIIQLNKDYVFAGVGQMDYNWLLEKYTFLDGSPCGKIIE